MNSCRASSSTKQMYSISVQETPTRPMRPTCTDGWAPGATAKPELLLTFPKEARGLNGSCLIAPDTILIADTFAGLIWRVDLSPSSECEPRVWLAHESMAHIADTLPPPPQPGINGIQYAS